MVEDNSQLPIPDNDDVTAQPIEPSLLETTDAGLDDPEVKAKLGEKGVAFLKRVIAEMRGRQAVADVIEADSDGLSRSTDELGEAGELKEGSPEALCLAQLKEDFDGGIVVVSEEGDVDAYKAAKEATPTAGQSWEAIKVRLFAKGGELLKKAAALQGRGRLVGVYSNGELAIRDRGTEPVIYATPKGGALTAITMDTPNREAVMQQIRDGEGEFADYWEIRQAVNGAGYHLPPDSPEYVKKGLVAASEAVSGEDYVRSTNGTDWRSAILECGNVSRSSAVRVVDFDPNLQFTDVNHDNPVHRDVDRGAVRWLRG
ncbi:MAG: hypothetical protein WC924_03480 [Candidatus Gracilibacteria bacterium]